MSTTASSPIILRETLQRRGKPKDLLGISPLRFVSVGMTVIFAFFFFLSFASHAAEQKESAYNRVMRTGTLRCGYYPWPPFFDVDPNTGAVSGMAADVANSVGRLLDLKVEYIQMAALGQQVEELKKGIYDAFCLDSYYVFSSIRYLDFSDPHYYAPVYAYVRSDETRFSTLQDFNKSDIIFVGIDADISTVMAQRRFPKAKVRSIPANSDGAQLMLDVMTGKADAAIIDPGIVREFNAKNPPGLKIIAQNDPVAVYPIGFSVLKGEDKLLRMLNGATSALHNTGEIRRIIQNYNLEGDALWPVAKPYEVQK